MSKISLVIPCYNEARRLRSDSIIGFLRQNPDINILFVNDGSNDQTYSVIENIASTVPQQVHTLHLSKNVGKAEAVRCGIMKLLESSEDTWFGYWDADLATPLTEIDEFLSFATDETLLLMGSRIKKMGSDINRKVWRHLCGRVMATLASLTLRLPVYDTQCGAKLIHRKTIKDVFGRPFISRWLFDIEIIARVVCANPERPPGSYIHEVPIRSWTDVEGSKLTWRNIICSFIDLIRINRGYGSMLSKARKHLGRQKQ